MILSQKARKYCSRLLLGRYTLNQVSKGLKLATVRERRSVRTLLLLVGPLLAF